MGTTAACLLIDLQQKRVVAVNSGDARILVQTKTGTFATNDHKPSFDSEKQRLKEKFNTNVFDFGGIMRVNGTLAVSRAIGDLDYKIYGVLALPEVYDEIAQDDVEFIVLACDGLWDVVSNQEVVDVVRSCVQGAPTTDAPCVKACLLYLEGKYEEGDALLKEELKSKCTEEPTYEEVELEGSKVTKADLPSKIA